MTSRQHDPETLRDLAETLSNKFKETYNGDKKELSATCNPSRYFAAKLFEQLDEFRDKQCTLQDPNKFTFSEFGDEIKPKVDTNNIGMKRKGIDGMDIDGPMNKKQKSMNDDNNKNENDMDNTMENDDSDDTDYDDDDDDVDMNKKKNVKKRKKVKLPDKYKDDEDFQALEGAPIEPSKADEFFDPLRYCQINEEQESKIPNYIKNKTRDYLNEYEMYHENDFDLKQEEIKQFVPNELNKYLKIIANKHGFTVQKDISTLLCLGLQDHLKNMFDEMEKWRKKRIIKKEDYSSSSSSLYKIKKNGINAQEWLDEINEKYAKKQEIVEAKDEVEALETEKADLDFKQMTGLLSDEEKKRKDKLNRLIREAKAKQKQTDSSDGDGSTALKAMGGDFSFGNSKNKNKNGGRKIMSDKYYSIDVVNMLHNHQKYNQQHLKQLSKMCLKQI